MTIYRFIEPETKTQTYIISTLKNNALIIDSVYADVDKYLKLLNANNLKLIYALDTHIHADHITCAGILKDKTGCKIAMYKSAKSSCVDLKLTDNEVITLDDLNIKIIYTPGHTIESCCFLINDRLFTGDTLLINACGRTDFQNGNASDLYDSIVNKILSLPDETIVYPGHDYNNRTISTILEQKLNNPRLQVKSISEFVEIMDNLNLPKPKYIDIAVPRNLQCGLELT